MEKLERDVLKIDFFGKEYVFERLNPYTIKINNGKTVSFASFSGELSVDTKKEFYEKPYLINFNTNLLISPGSILKFFLKLPIVTKLVLKTNDKYIDIDKHIEYNRMAWHGEVHRGVLCTFVEAEFSFGGPFNTRDALVPVRIINKSEVQREISKIVIEPENMILLKGDNGLFTNKVYILAVSSNEFGVDYSPKATTMVVNPQIIIDRKISVAKTVLIRFDKFGIARELGL